MNGIRVSPSSPTWVIPTLPSCTPCGTGWGWRPARPRPSTSPWTWTPIRFGDFSSRHELDWCGLFWHRETKSSSPWLRWGTFPSGKSFSPIRQTETSTSISYRWLLIPMVQKLPIYYLQGNQLTFDPLRFKTVNFLSNMFKFCVARTLSVLSHEIFLD